MKPAPSPRVALAVKNCRRVLEFRALMTYYFYLDQPDHERVEEFLKERMFLGIQGLFNEIHDRWMFLIDSRGFITLTPTRPKFFIHHEHRSLEKAAEI